MRNNKQETIEEAAERILSKEGIKRHPSGLETYLKGNVINAMVEMVKWQVKEMEKERIIDAFVECWKANMPDGYECKLSAEQYYEQTYGGGNK